MNLFSNKPCLITGEIFNPNFLKSNETFSLNCKNEINSTDLQNQPSTNSTKSNSVKI